MDWITVQVTQDPDKLRMLRGAMRGVYRSIAEIGTVEVKDGSAELDGGRIKAQAKIGGTIFSLGAVFLNCTREQASEIGISALDARGLPYLARPPTVQARA